MNLRGRCRGHRSFASLSTPRPLIYHASSVPFARFSPLAFSARYASFFEEYLWAVEYLGCISSHWTLTSTKKSRWIELRVSYGITHQGASSLSRAGRLVGGTCGSRRKGYNSPRTSGSWTSTSPSSFTCWVDPWKLPVSWFLHLFFDLLLLAI